jgi:hypothetical protein
MKAYAQQLNIKTEAQQFHQQFLRQLKMVNVDSNMQCGYTSGVERILKFKALKGFKKQVTCKMANN